MNAYLKYTSKEGNPRRANLGTQGAEVYGHVGDPLKLEPGEIPPAQRCRIFYRTKDGWLVEPLPGASDLRLDGAPLIATRVLTDNAELELGNVLLIVKLSPTIGVPVPPPTHATAATTHATPPAPLQKPPAPATGPTAPLPDPRPSENKEDAKLTEALRKLEWDNAQAHQDLATLRERLDQERAEHLTTKNARRQANQEIVGLSAVAQELREARDKLLADCSLLQEQHAKGQRRIEEQSIVIDAARAEQRADQKALRKEKDLHEQTLRELEAARVDIRTLQTTNAQLLALEAERSKRSEHLSQVLNDLKQRQAPIERALHEARNEADKLNKEIPTLRGEVEHLRARANEADELRRRLAQLMTAQPTDRPTAPGPGSDESLRTTESAESALLETQLQLADALATLETVSAGSDHRIMQGALAKLGIALEHARLSRDCLLRLTKTLRRT